MRNVIKGFFHDLPDGQTISIRHKGFKRWSVCCRWYKTAERLDQLRKSYPAYTFDQEV